MLQARPLRAISPPLPNSLPFTPQLISGKPSKTNPRPLLVGVLCRENNPYVSGDQRR